MKADVNARALTMPECYKKAVIYQLFLRAFHPRGTLQAATGMLDELADLGVDIVYLCPIAAADEDMRQEFWSDRQKASGIENPKNPYRIKDYFAIYEEYGTDEDLRAFVRKAHRLGLKVLLDLVYFHCGPTAVFIQEHPDYVRHTESGEIDCGDWHFPKLNFDNPELREYLYQNMEYFIREFDVDGYRCDVGAACPLDFWVEGRRRIDALKKDLFMLNEADNPAYLVDAFEADYGWKHWHVPLLKVMSGELPACDLVKSWTDYAETAPNGSKCILSIDNHDHANDAYDDRYETRFGTRAIEAALFLNMTMEGIPFLYNGYEVCDDNRHSIYGNRFLGRGMTVNWANGFTPKGKARYAFLRRMIRLRHGNPALWDGELQWNPCGCKEHVLSFCRITPEQRIFVVVNMSGEAIRTEVFSKIDGDIKILEHRDAAVQIQDNVMLDLLPHGFVMFEY